MRIESKLCHLTEKKAVVQVNGWLNEKNLGSALAEGPTVEIAEDKAISRLNERLKINSFNDKSKKSITEDNSRTTKEIELPKSDKHYKDNEPIDWSNELAAIDLEIKRLKWSRDDENHFLEKNLGYNNRNNITNYKDILSYLRLLKDAEISTQSKGSNSNIDNLIEESDSILRDLSWNHSQGRDYLQKEFNVSTRKELNRDQLISFITMLKLIRNKNV